MPKSSTEILDDITNAIRKSNFVWLGFFSLWVLAVILNGSDSFWALIALAGEFAVAGFQYGIRYLNRKQQELQRAIILEKTGLQ